MPAPAPIIGDLAAAELAALGAHLRSRRKALGVSAVAAAEAAGISRVTLHRIERGEPSVSAAAYASAIAVLGLKLRLMDPQATAPADAEQPDLPATLRISDYPQLERLAWQLKGTTELTPRQALDLYERNWRHVDEAAMDPRERRLVAALVKHLGGGRRLV